MKSEISNNNINMNKASLKKLSKSELIKLLLKQEKNPKTVVVNKKPNKKQKVVYNHDNLFDNDLFPDVTSDPIERMMKKVIKRDKNINEQTSLINDRYSKLVTDERKVTHYPMIRATLDEFRRDEVRRSNDKDRRLKSFVYLFGKRLDEMQGRRDKVSIKIHIEITNALHGFNRNESVSKHTYGPFTVNKPYNMSKRDGYKFALYTLMNKKITFLSGEYVTKIGFDITRLNKKRPRKHKLGKLKLESYLLNKQCPITRHGENTCVVDYVWDQVRGKRGFKSYTYEKLKSEIYEFVAEGDDMISTDELINWADKCHNNVSIHAYDARYRKFVAHIGKTNRNVSLVYIVKDHHCHPITDEKLKIVASKANQGGCDNLLKYMSDIKWTRRHENITKLNNINEIYSLDAENNIIILPEEAKMRDAINSYSRSENFYVEYLHWNNNGILDGFIDHKKNMYLLNEGYNTRKTICDKLFNIYKTHEFKWTNQSYTSISTALFRQLNGYIPESSYNVNTRQMLDDFYPRALQWCTTDDVPDDVVSIDIAKCYPSILLNNNHEIPVYSIHDVVEQFNCKSDLKHCGEFYIDETILYNYETPLKIEAGFYSSNLISYLVNELNMPTNQIKYKIVSKKALKPNTFSEYIKYIFDNFSESEAKKMANSFIGELGRRYNKTNHGFTCTDYDTAMCCWTSGLSEGKNVTVDHHDGIFMIREQNIERIFSDHTSINRFVVSEAILKCLQLIETCHGEDSVLYGYNTDGIYITNPKVQFKNKKDVKFSTKRIGRAYVTDSELVYFEKHYRENMDMSDYKSETGKGCIYNGQAESGKTTKLCRMVQETERPLVLSFTNKAVENVKNRLIQTGYEKEVANKICHTFDSYFCEWSDGNYHGLEGKTIFIEEFSMVPNKWITKIYHEYLKHSNTVYMFGDPNQCEPVEGGSQIHYDYLAPVVQKLDRAIHRINLYPVDNAIVFPNTYPLDSDLSVG